MTEHKPQDSVPATSVEDPQLAYLANLQEEATHLSPEERAEQESLILELQADMDLAERIRHQVDEDIARAKKLAGGIRNETVIAPIVTVRRQDIGWIDGEEEADMEATRHTEKGVTYDFIDLISESGVTQRVFDELKKQGLDKELIGKLLTDVLPVFCSNIKEGRGMRPISIGGRHPKDVDAEHSLNTKYPGFKVGLHGTNNRAILLVLGDHDGIPVIGLAAMYDHDDDRAVHHKLFKKQH